MSQVFNLELFGEMSIYQAIGIKILCAIIAGATIGLEREIKRKPAGIKTNVMICLGATLYTSISLIYVGSNTIVNFDPNRVAAQIVSGIGFLGAGAIMRSGGSVNGLTTAATIWVVAAIGVVIGMGYPIVALGVVLSVLIILISINPLYSLLSIHKDYYVVIRTAKNIRKIVYGMSLNSSIDIISTREKVVDEDSGETKMSLVINGRGKDINKFVTLINGLKEVREIKYELYEP